MIQLFQNYEVGKLRTRIQVSHRNHNIYHVAKFHHWKRTPLQEKEFHWKQFTLLSPLGNNASGNTTEYTSVIIFLYTTPW